jgi:hypothetical protein
MIVCAPDMTVEIAAKFGVQPCQLITLSLRPPLRRDIDILADIGLRAAKEGADLWRYADLVAEVRPRWAIAPDAFGDFYRTLELWRRPYAAPVCLPGVLQSRHAPHPHRPRRPADAETPRRQLRPAAPPVC